MGGDAFLTVLKYDLSEEHKPTYSLSLRSYRSLKDLYEDKNVDFLRFLGALRNRPQSWVILDDPSNFDYNDLEVGAWQAINQIVQMISDAVPEVKIVIRLRAKVFISYVSPIILSSLDEADCRTYVKLHPDAAFVPETGLNSSALFRYTRGEPERIDKFLQLAKTSTVESIIFKSSNDAITHSKPTVTLSDSLRERIDEVLTATSPDISRDAMFLRALLVFPAGASDADLRYLYNSRPIHAERIAELHALGIVDSIPLKNYKGEGLPIRLVKSRLDVAEYVRAATDIKDLRDLTERAIGAYLGKNWLAGDFSLNRAVLEHGRNPNPVGPENIIDLLSRYFADCFESNSGAILSKAVAAIEYYTKKLYSTGFYRQLYNFCSIAIPAIERDYEGPELTGFRYRHGAAARMLDYHMESLAIFEDMLPRIEDLGLRRRVHLELAWCYNALKKASEAEEQLAIILKQKIKDSAHIEAEALSITLNFGEKSLRKLYQLHRSAEKNGYNGAADNIMLNIVSYSADDSFKLKRYRQLASDGSTPYNKVRATLRYCELSINDGSLSESDINRLLDSYAFSRSERMGSLFKTAHRLLWLVLEDNGEISSLITVFEHSSLFFRLSEDLNSERTYLKRLIERRDFVPHLLDSASRRYIHSRMTELEPGLLEKISPAISLNS